MKQYKFPVVKEGTRFSVQGALEEDPKFEVKLYKRYTKENPELMKWVDGFISVLPEECQRAALYAAIIPLRIIESQGEADALNRELNGRQL